MVSTSATVKGWMNNITALNHMINFRRQGCIWVDMMPHTVEKPEQELLTEKLNESSQKSRSVDGR